MHAPRGNEARMQSSTLRKRGIHVPSKLVHPDEKFKGPTKRVRIGFSRRSWLLQHDILCSLYLCSRDCGNAVGTDRYRRCY